MRSPHPRAILRTRTNLGEFFYSWWILTFLTAVVILEEDFPVIIVGLLLVLILKPSDLLGGGVELGSVG